MPSDIAYSCIIGTAWGGGDGIVTEASQSLNTIYPQSADALTVWALHCKGVRFLSLLAPLECECHDVIVKALDEPDNFATKYEIAEGKFDGFIQKSNDVDVYKIISEGTFRPYMRLSNLCEDCSLTVYDSIERLVAKCDNSGTTAETIQYPLLKLDAGTYYIKIASKGTGVHLSDPYLFEFTGYPDIAITSPSDGGTVSGITDITADASDNVAVEKVEFYIEGILKHIDTNSPYLYSWDTGDYNNGQSYLIVAKALDGAGNHSSDNINVTVYNSPINWPPEITLLSPNGDVANNSFGITWTDEDIDDNATINLYRDSNNSGYDGTLIVSGLKEDDIDYYSWNTSALPDESSWYVYAIISDESDDDRSYSPGAVFIDHPTTVDNFEVDHTVLFDNNADGDEDGVLESGETATYRIYLENTSGQTWYTVYADFSTSNPEITILNSRVCYSTMSPGDISYGDGSFKFDTPSDFTGNISFILTIGYKNVSGSPYQDIENLNVYVSSPGSSSPAFSVETITYNDSDGNNDGMLQSGEESIDFFVKLKNTGSATAINVRGTIHDVSEIDFSDREENYPDIVPGESSNPNGDFDIRSIPQSYSGTLDMTMTVEYGPSHSQSQDVPFTMTVYPAPYMYVHPKSWDFGLVSPGTSVIKTVQIDNYGNTDLQVYSIEPDNSDTDITGISLPLTIGAGTSQSFNIEINTTGLNAFITRIVTVSSNAHLDSIQIVTVTGTVTNPPSGEYHVIWSKDIPHQEQLGSWISNIGVGDTDGDGKREIIVTTYGQFYDGDADSARVYVYERITDDNYDTVWCSSEISLLAENTIETHGLAIGDVTGDGKDDIVVVARQGYDNAGVDPIYYGEDRVYVFESTADNTWANTWTGMTEIGAIKSLAIGDSDSDGNKEIIVTDSNKKIYVYERSGGSFSKTWESSPIENQNDPGELVDNVMSVVVDDSDSDGHKEIIVATNYGQFFVFENTGNNSYSQSFVYQDWDNGWDVAHIAVDDVDNDGNREIILVSDISPQLRIYECNGDNSYDTTSPSQYVIGDEGYCVITGDTDDDGNKEIIVGTMDWKGSVQILENFSDNSYVEVWRDSAGEIDTDMYTIALDNTNSDNYVEIITGADSKISVVGFSTSPDLQIVGQNISFDKTTPTDADSIQITATVQNIGSGDASGITVRFYNGNPDSGGTQIGTDETITSVASGNSESVYKTLVPITDDTFHIYVKVDPDSNILESDETNNLASKSIVVIDNDIDPPSISNVLVQEYSGDNDGLIEDNEQVKISWILSDPSEVCTSSCKIDTITYGASNQDSLYYVIQGPFSAGTDSFTISATDNDNSKETSTSSGTFDVELHAPSVVSTSPVDNDTTVSANTSIEVTFNEAIQESTVNANTFYLKDSLYSIVAGTLAYYIADKKAVFTPNSRLDNKAYYTTTVVSGDTGVKDHNGNNMDIDYVWSFRTIPDTTSPTTGISAPADSSNLKGSISIFGTVLDDNFDRYVVEYKGLSDWDTIGVVHTESVFDSMLETWNTTLVTDGSYIVRLTAIDIFDNISIDSIIVFVDNSAPNIPSLITPADSSVVSDTTPTFIWHLVSGTDISYILEYATDSMFTANLVQVSSISETTYTVIDTMSLEHNRHYWHTRAIDGIGNSSEYQSYPFSFLIDMPPEISAIPDTNFEENDSLKIDLDNYVEDLDDPDSDLSWSYSICETKGDEFKILFQKRLSDKSFMDIQNELNFNKFINPRRNFNPQSFAKDGPFYVTIDSNHVVTFSATPYWNGSRNVIFTVMDPDSLIDVDTMTVTVLPVNYPPNPFALVLPRDDSLLSISTPTFMWESSLDSDPEDTISYILEIAFDSLFSKIVHSISDIPSSSYVLPDTMALTDSMHYWRVKAVDDSGAASDFQSHPFSFIIDATAPAVPVLLTPSDSSILSNSSPTFVWGSVTKGEKSAQDAISFSFKNSKQTQNVKFGGIRIIQSGSSAKILGTPIAYTLEYALDSVFSQSVVRVNSLIDSVYTIPDLLTDTLYYWHVEAFDQAGHYSDYQEKPFTFTIDTTSPNIFDVTIWNNTDSTGPFPVRASITDKSDISLACLWYKTSVDTTWKADTIAADSNGYIGEIPKQPENTTVYYYIQAEDRSQPPNIATNPLNAPPDSVYHFIVLQVGIEDQVFIPKTFELFQTYPNPFTAKTEIRYGLPKDIRVTLSIYDVTGTLVTILVNGSQKAGYHKIYWNGKDGSGRKVSSGIYFYRLQTVPYTKARKVLIVK